jgi:DNA (cytosine-5)-methyltransferase 1
MSKHKFPYRWNLSDGYPANGIEKHGLKVFGTFICGGGSTMGYKLAGYEHIGGVEIDPKVADVYNTNHKPKLLYTEDIRAFAKRDNLPAELYNLDLLDGSPPCSSFSMAGNREKDWGKKKKFREGQALQTLDDLFFDYIALAKKLQPKVVIAENVKGLIQGNAKSYVKKIKAGFEDAGYKVQLFLLNAASMGVPQKRERVFFICQRKDLNYKPLKLEFNEEGIVFERLREGVKNKASDNDIALSKKGGFVKNTFKTQVHNTILGSTRYIDEIGVLTNDLEFCLIGSYPIDYKFKDIKPQYLIGMSVPPVMTAQIAHEIYLQWLRN